MAQYSFQSASAAIQSVKSGDRVFVQGGAMTPQVLLEALVARSDELRDVELVHLHTEGPAAYAKPGLEASFKTRCLFVGANTREAVERGAADYLPVFLSDVPHLFRSGLLQLDVALIQVSPPDDHGNCSLGTSVDVTLAAVQSAGIVIAVVNPRVPRTFGDSVISINRLHLLVEADRELQIHHPEPVSPSQQAIGKHVASLIENGATLQMGIGGIPDAVLSELTGHARLGIHTEMFSDGLVDLVGRGVITGECKKRTPHRIVSAFIIGTRKVFDFVHNNPAVEMREMSYTNDTSIIRQNPRCVAINSAIEVDLTGQVCADSIGTKQYSGVGGQMDFMRGAALSHGGKAIIALPSETSSGISRIVAMLKPGASVTTTRAHVRFVITEHGIADLYGKTLRERAAALIKIAAPRHRELLSQQLASKNRSH